MAGARQSEPAPDADASGAPRTWKWSTVADSASAGDSIPAKCADGPIPPLPGPSISATAELPGVGKRSSGLIAAASDANSPTGNGIRPSADGARRGSWAANASQRAATERLRPEPGNGVQSRVHPRATGLGPQPALQETSGSKPCGVGYSP